MKIILLILAGCSLLLYCLLVCLPSEHPDIIRFLIVSQVLVIVYLLMLFFARRFDIFGTDRKFFLILIIIAVVIRIIIPIGSEQATYLSDDVYRYVWEGKLVTHGYNPFTTTPTSMSQSGMADSTIYPHINHPRLPTIYPPLSQYFFAVSYLLDNDTICGFKILSFLFELLTLLTIIFLLKNESKRHPISGWQALLYMFSPLVLIEFLMSNHLDILAMPFFVLSLYFLRKEHSLLTGIMLALATMVKLFGFFFLPVLFFHFTKKDRIKFILAFACTVTALYTPFFISSGSDVFGSLFTYLADGQFNGSIFPVLQHVVGENTARYLVGIIFFLVTGVVSIFFRNRIPDPIERMVIVFGAYIMLSPSVFPWYLVWIIPFLVLRVRLPFLILTGTVLLSYHVLISYYDTGVWSESWGIVMIEYIPFYTLMGYQVITKRKQRSLSRII